MFPSRNSQWEEAAGSNPLLPQCDWSIKGDLPIHHWSKWTLSLSFTYLLHASDSTILSISFTLSFVLLIFLVLSVLCHNYSCYSLYCPRVLSNCLFIIISLVYIYHPVIFLLFLFYFFSILSTYLAL